MGTGTEIEGEKFFIIMYQFGIQKLVKPVFKSIKNERYRTHNVHPDCKKKMKPNRTIPVWSSKYAAGRPASLDGRGGDFRYQPIAHCMSKFNVNSEP